MTQERTNHGLSSSFAKDTLIMSWNKEYILLRFMFLARHRKILVVPMYSWNKLPLALKLSLRLPISIAMRINSSFPI
jgi:hypothetical protein